MSARFRNRAFMGVALGMVAMVTLTASLAPSPADAREPLPGTPITDADVRLLTEAAASCPTLTPARLAGQVMAASRFSATPVEAVQAVGGQGTAGLVPTVWQKWAPWDGARPADRPASITALAHHMCQLVGQLRVLELDGDKWLLALAAHRLGVEPVVEAGDVPVGAAEYVDTVERYAIWYASQPAFGGSGRAAAEATQPAVAQRITRAAPLPVPDVYLELILAAGAVCPQMPPTRVAAQLMATSEFDPQRLGPTGEQGIAQFLPEMWVAYVRPSAEASPWTPAAAVPALGETMCALLEAVPGTGPDAYSLALAVFLRGDPTIRSLADVPGVERVVALAEQVGHFETEYGKDPRLAPSADPSPSAAPVASPTTESERSAEASTAPTTAAPPRPSPPATKPSTPAQTDSDQPPVRAKDADGTNRSYGPYFIHNLGTDRCIDIPGVGPGPRDGPVLQDLCYPHTPDNQEYAFVPRRVDSSGNQLYWIRSVTSQYCLDLPGKGSVAPTTPLNETGCYDDENQYWRLQPTVKSGDIQYYWVINTASNLCLDVPGYATGGIGLRLEVYECWPDDDHDWALIRKANW
ncbi:MULTISPECIES: RICIN domain-containing protein [unclassified Solwaraspora]|uniref:RICIN domain-containing protein n=1 Tax=unclassified Solwaraspora TaxID=2627926 RepID=UPI00248C8657|nr:MULTISPECIES: RICIN domain-containing protein [unclassified Solwaraspora]WBB97211.1 RICIN domain-containing protein [Solwaraspora sp. WMMA2059]WBC18887.1 RICIN domain-containing protein [Solwaraspora sp. WMMA2080]WJK33710.1 RICIN domain-containing protein [Solwaraspora sp. WMMA2065]